MNIAVWFAILSSTAFVVDRWIRGPRRFQVSVGSVLTFTGTVVIMMALLRREPDFVFQSLGRGFEWSMLVNWHDIRLPLGLPNLLAVCCTICTLRWAELFLVGGALKTWRAGRDPRFLPVTKSETQRDDRV